MTAKINTVIPSATVKQFITVTFSNKIKELFINIYRKN
jgi:hypothetical protein